MPVAPDLYDAGTALTPVSMPVVSPDMGLSGVCVSLPYLSLPQSMKKYVVPAERSVMVVETASMSARPSSLVLSHFDAVFDATSSESVP